MKRNEILLTVAVIGVLGFIVYKRETKEKEGAKLATIPSGTDTLSAISLDDKSNLSIPSLTGVPRKIINKPSGASVPIQGLTIDSLISPLANTPRTTGGLRCPEGQILCPDGSKCYDPNVESFANPCSGTLVDSSAAFAGKKSYVSNGFFASQKQKLNY